MSTLTTQTKKVCGIVSLGCVPDGVDIRLTMLKDFLEDVSEVYAFILHNQDFSDDGSLATPHLHFVFKSKKRHALSWFMNRIADKLEVSVMAVSIDSYSSFDGCVQYLVHKNNPDKYQYPDDWIHSNLPRDELRLILESTNTGVDFDSWLDLCKRSRSLLDVIQAVSIPIYNLYQRTIKDMFALTHNGSIY